MILERKFTVPRERGVDFVVQHGSAITAIEVKATPLTRPKITRSARSFVSAYRPQNLIIINTALHLDETLEKTPVRFRRPFELIEVLSEMTRDSMT